MVGIKVAVTPDTRMATMPDTKSGIKQERNVSSLKSALISIKDELIEAFYESRDKGYRNGDYVAFQAVRGFFLVYGSKVIFRHVTDTLIVVDGDSIYVRRLPLEQDSFYAGLDMLYSGAILLDLPSDTNIPNNLKKGAKSVVVQAAEDVSNLDGHYWSAL